MLIHFLQRRAKVVTVSTLFLLRQTQRESTSGRRFDRLVNSIPLWLQILAILLVTWLLIQPRYVKAKSTQRIAIVLDSSASMQVFKNKIAPALAKEIPRLQGNAANAEIYILESNPLLPKIYQGSSHEKMIAALDGWTPKSGASDPSHSLRIARSLVGAEGAISYITDIPVDYPLPYHSSYLAIGENTPNVGITGVSFEQRDGQLIWKSIIRNYSDSPQQRTWHLETAKHKSKPRELNLAAGKLTTLQGTFPKGAKRCQLVLNKDSFTLDDSLPMVRPSPKSLTVTSQLTDNSQELTQRMLKSFPNLHTANNQNTCDLVITSTETTPSTNNLIVFPSDRASSRPHLTGNIVAPKHPLTEGLNWQTLLARASIPLPHDQTDDVLLWQGNRALIFLRTHPTSLKKALVFNFDIQQSNALKQPATAVLLLRFCEQLRNEKIAPETRITETGEPIQLTRHKGNKAPPLNIQQLSLDGQTLKTSQHPHTTNNIYAPNNPGFFTITQGDETLFTSATHFADTREADFSNCSSDDLPASKMATAVDRHTRDDHLWRLWTCLVLTATTGAWYFTRSAKTSTKPQSN